LSRQDIDAFLARNPEVEKIVDAVIAAISAFPPLDIPEPPPEADSCVALGLPENGSQVPAEGIIQFDWYDQDGVYKYILNVTKPNGAERSWIAFRSSIQVDALDLPLEGTYSWSVTAYDANIHPICTSETWTFSKPATPPAPEGECFQLTGPEAGIELPETGTQTFTWTELPGRYKYIIMLTAPDGSETSKIVFTNSYTLPLESLLLGGEYQWQVTAYDSNIKPMCTAGPFTFTKPGSTAPPPETGCVTLLTPGNGAELDADGPQEFTWSAHPYAYKYLINFKGPRGGTDSLIAFTPYHLRYMGSLAEGGTYEWWVTVKNSSLNVICNSEHFTFTKAKSTIPPPVPGGTGSFSNRSGPTGSISGCNVSFAVDTQPPSGAMVKVIYSYDSVPDGYSDPHYILSHQGGSRYGTSVSLSVPAGKTVYWRFAIINGGTYFHDEDIFSFVSPGGCPAETPNTPTVFGSISGPEEVVSSLPVHYEVEASDAEGLQYIKVKYKVVPPAGDPVEAYTILAYNGSLWVGDVDFGSLEAGSTITWWIWAIDNAGKSTYSGEHTFLYSP
jgi:hypothetical protein